jgi:hypothetical protein
MYRIREVDGQDEEISEALAELHWLTFFGTARTPDFQQGHWWFVFCEASPVAFAGVIRRHVSVTPDILLASAY